MFCCQNVDEKQKNTNSHRDKPYPAWSFFYYVIGGKVFFVQTLRCMQYRRSFLANPTYPSLRSGFNGDIYAILGNNHSIFYGITFNDVLSLERCILFLPM